MTDDTDRPRRARRRSAGENDAVAPDSPPVARPQPDVGPATERFHWDGGSGGDATEEFRWDAVPDGDATQPFRWSLDSQRGATTEPTPVDRSLDGAPPADGQPPTEATAWETAVVPQVAPGGPIPRASGRQPDPATGLTGIDALFQPGQFRDFEPTAILPRDPRPASSPAGSTAVRAPRTGPSLTSGQRALLWAAAVLVAILVLIALFAIGRRLPAMFATPQPAATSTPTPTPAPTRVDTAAGPVGPGGYAWDQLRGGECLQPYQSAWQEHYTVVDCATPHTAQLLIRATFPDEVAPGGGYPGFDELAAQINLLCTDPSVIDYAPARDYDDIVIEGAHAVTAEEWAEGHNEYYCFLSRSSGEPLTGSLAVAAQ